MHDLAYRQFELSYKFMLKRRVRATMQWGETHFEAVFLFQNKHLCFYKTFMTELPTYFRESKGAQIFFPLDSQNTKKLKVFINNKRILIRLFQKKSQNKVHVF